MTTYARIVDGYAVDVGTADPATMYFPSVAAQFQVVPDDTEEGDKQDHSTKKWSRPAPVTPAAAVTPSMSPMTFYLAFTPQERNAIRVSKDALVADFWDTYQRLERTGTEVDPNSNFVQGALAYLVTAEILDPPHRVNEILAGVPK